MTPNGRMWHRYTYDGYGEKADGSPWDGTGIGRLWPLLGGERGEYEVARGNAGLSYLETMARSANKGYMIPEQVWDQPEPTSYGHVFGDGTGSAPARWPGRWRSMSGWPGRSRRGTPSRPRRWSPTATPTGRRAVRCSG